MGKVIKKDDIDGDVVGLEHKNGWKVLECITATPKRQELLDESKQGLIDLSVKMAEKIVGEAVNVNPELLNKIYKRALDEVASLGSGQIQVHPDALEKTDITKMAKEYGFSVKPDLFLGLSDCVVTAGGVTLDSRVDSVLLLFKKAMEKQIK